MSGLFCALFAFLIVRAPPGEYVRRIVSLLWQMSSKILMSAREIDGSTDGYGEPSPPEQVERECLMGAHRQNQRDSASWDDGQVECLAQRGHPSGEGSRPGERMSTDTVAQRSMCPNCSKGVGPPPAGMLDRLFMIHSLSPLGPFFRFPHRRGSFIFLS